MKDNGGFTGQERLLLLLVAFFCLGLVLLSVHEMSLAARGAKPDALARAIAELSIRPVLPVQRPEAPWVRYCERPKWQAGTRFITCAEMDGDTVFPL